MRNLQAEIQQRQEAQNDEHTAHNAQLFAHHGKNVVGVVRGQIQKLLARIAQTYAEQSAIGQRVQRVDSLISCAKAVLTIIPRVKIDHALATVAITKRVHQGKSNKSSNNN